MKTNKEVLGAIMEDFDKLWKTNQIYDEYIGLTLEEIERVVSKHLTAYEGDNIIAKWNEFREFHYNENDEAWADEFPEWVKETSGG